MKKMTGKMAMAMAGLMAFGTMGTGVTAMAAEDGDVVTIKFMHKDQSQTTGMLYMQSTKKSTWMRLA